MEIGDTIDPQEESAPPRRKRSGQAGGDQNAGAAVESTDETRIRRKNGSGAVARQRNGNGRSGSDGDGSPSRTELQGLLVGLRDLREGEFEVRIPDSADPLMAQIADAFNGIAERNERLTSEVVRVSTTIGREGQMNERASIGRAAGGWATMTSSLNSLIIDLASPTTEVARVLTAVAEGDLSQKMVLEIDGKSVQGEFLRIGTTVNEVVDQLSAFASEVTRVAKEVGTEGKLGGQAHVPGVAGTWKDLTDNVNTLAGNLTSQVRNIADVTTAVAKGDLSRKITVEARGETLELKNTINTMVDQLGAFASEVTRVAKEVGTEGKLGGQAEAPGVAGTWKDLTDNVNAMAGNLTGQIRNIADVTTAVAKGDLSRKITVDVQGEMLELKQTINTMVDQLSSFASEVTRVAREVGTEGRLGGQAQVPGVAGTWKDLTDNVNFMASNLTGQVRNIADVTTAVARGDLSRKMTVDVKGEILELKNTINIMVDQLSAFSSEVTRVAREVGTEGRLGGQAQVPGVAGTWKDLTDNVNTLAGNLTGQIRNIALVTTAVAQGDLSQKITVEVRGEILELINTINAMVDSLRVFAYEVTRVAKEVGTEGKLGGQAEVPGAAGTWRALTDNVNAMANSLTLQVRAIADVATAVTSGDLSRQITMEAQGELDELKGNLNQMIANLKGTTEKNTEQDWLKTNLAKYSRMMQGQKDLESVSRLIMSELTPLMSAHHGAFYIMEREGASSVLKLIASYAYKERKHVANRFVLGEGLVGQAALEKKPILLTNVPSDYIQITSGLGEAPPRNILVMPVLFEGEVKAVIELASFLPFSQIHQLFLDQLGEGVGVVLNMIAANMRTSELLEQSQSLTQELQSQSQELQQQQAELRKSNSDLEAQTTSLRTSEELLRDQQVELQQVNEELEEKASLLAEQNRKVEQKNDEVEAARVALEEKAEQLAVSSKYKSEFLANMSHELRTPLNSLLILSKLLADNKEGNLSPKQMEYAQTINSSGSDLLSLINDVLDLSKVEAGKMEVNPGDVFVSEVKGSLQRSFGPLADEKKLAFTIDVATDVPATIRTDGQRLEQVLRNLLSNAFKFTSEGSVSLNIRRADKARRFANPVLDNSPMVMAFAVMDTGLGIARDKQRLIFEAFQQADGTTSRKFGGTGLGLSISREIARLLGGEIRVESMPEKGSTFTLFLPISYTDPQPADYPRHSQPSAAGTGEATRVARPRPNPTWKPTPARGSAAVQPERRARQYVVEDDHESIEPGDRTLLIIENDVNFAKILLGMAREKSFKGIVSLDGDDGLALTQEYRPDAITLDIDMPGMDGWKVLERLKHNPQTRHIPVHIISGIERRQQGLKAGAIAYLSKPVTKEALDKAFATISRFLVDIPKHLLVVEDDAMQRDAIVELIAHEDVEITAVDSAEAAMEQLSSGKHYDCVVLDLGLHDMSGFDFLEKVKSDPMMSELPIIVYTGRQLTGPEETRVKKYAETIIVKDAKSPERLLDETALFLHRVEAKMPETKRKMLEQLHDVDEVIAGKRVLIVDDDVRNIFSLTSVLEDHGMDVRFAENGKDALAVLEEDSNVDVVLMDVMMPEMDGYDTMKAIRSIPRFKSLPIIALTAKAMKGDREKCITAGASDYIMKPVDTEQLISLLRVWLYK